MLFFETVWFIFGSMKSQETSTHNKLYIHSNWNKWFECQWSQSLQIQVYTWTFVLLEKSQEFSKLTQIVGMPVVYQFSNSFLFDFISKIQAILI